MQNNPKPPTTSRIDLSNCKLLSTYGRDLASSAADAIKVGELVKPGILTKIGAVIKTGMIIKPRLR